MDFLKLLRDDLRKGLIRHPEPARLARHARWLTQQQGPAGGFRNRRGREDLYYTAFAVRALSALEALDEETAARTLGFLAQQAACPGAAFGNAVHAVSWWDAFTLCRETGVQDKSVDVEKSARHETTERLGRLRCDDGGWAKTETEVDGSVYHTFLAACALQRMGLSLAQEDADRLLAFLATRAASGGGYLESRYSKTPGVNGTAAGIALGLLAKAVRMKLGAAAVFSLSALPSFARRALAVDSASHAEFLRGMQNEEGGFRASPNAPFADLLSTYTALLSLELLGRRLGDATRKALAFARSIEASEGGYLGFALERTPDCEYTFYGLGVERMGCHAPDSR